MRLRICVLLLSLAVGAPLVNDAENL